MVKNLLSAILLLAPVNAFADALGGENPLTSTTQLAITGSAQPTAAVNRVVDVSNTASTIGSGTVLFNEYNILNVTGSTDNTGNTAHVGASLDRSSVAASVRTDVYNSEFRVDSFNAVNGSSPESYAAYSYMLAPNPAGVSAGNVWSAHRFRACHTSGEDCGGSARASGTVRTITIDDQIGGTIEEAIHQAGADDQVTFLGNIVQGGTAGQAIDSGYGLKVNDLARFESLVAFLGPQYVATQSPPGAVAGFAIIYSTFGAGATAELFVTDGAGNRTQISPHDDKNQWVFNSSNDETGRSVYIPMEELVRDLERFTGRRYIHRSKADYESYIRRERRARSQIKRGSKPQ